MSNNIFENLTRKIKIVICISGFICASLAGL
nr:MAG TPA: hypothetical protein [Caudoviricetes sp.]